MMRPTDPILDNDWYVVAKSADLLVGKLISIQLLEGDLVLWRSSKGGVLAWEDRCSHRGAKLSSGSICQQEDTLVCPYHGMTFDTGGNCIKIPAHPTLNQPGKTSRLRVYSTRENYGFIWVSPGLPTHDLPVLPEWQDPNFRHFTCGPYPIQTSAPRVLENFIDVAHFPFLHEGLLGDHTDPEIPDFSVTIDPDGITAHNIQVYQPNPEGTGEGKRVTYVYRVLRPFVAYFRKATGDTHFAISLFLTPVKELQTIAWLNVSRDFAHDVPDQTLREFQDLLIAQDIPIVESQTPQRVPLDLEAEFHFPADQLGIAYRKWLKQLNIRFGTC